MKEVKLNIEGMHCTGCSTRLEKVLNNVDGVKGAKVSLEEKKADIKYDETQVSEKELIEVVEDAGFKKGKKYEESIIKNRWNDMFSMFIRFRKILK